MNITPEQYEIIDAVRKSKVIERQFARYVQSDKTLPFKEFLRRHAPRSRTITDFAYPKEFLVYVNIHPNTGEIFRIGMEGPDHPYDLSPFHKLKKGVRKSFSDFLLSRGTQKKIIIKEGMSYDSARRLFSDLFHQHKNDELKFEGDNAQGD